MRDQDHRRVDARSDSARATPATRCRGGWWARRAAAGRASTASARASEARVSSPPEKLDERPVELGAVEAEPAQRDVDAVAPAIAAGVLEPRLGVGVGRRGSPASESPSAIRARARRARPRSRAIQSRPAATYSRSVASGARRPLVVQRDADALVERDQPAVEPASPAIDPQQGGLAAAVAAEQRHPLAAVELEREVGEQRPRADVLDEAGGRDDRQGGAWGLDARPACSAASSRTWNEEPQPQAATTFGLLTVNPAPWRPST